MLLLPFTVGEIFYCRLLFMAYRNRDRRSGILQEYKPLNASKCEDMPVDANLCELMPMDANLSERQTDKVGECEMIPDYPSLCECKPKESER